MKFRSVFCHDNGVVNVVLELIFYIFCNDRGVLNVVTVGIKICILSCVVNVVGVMT